MNRDVLVQCIAGTVAAAAIGVGGVLGPEIFASATRNKLVYADRASQAYPPQVGVGIAIGAFRGLAVNFLWIRANQLKEDGKYHEAMTLARAITQLQPRFGPVWVFHAWNMAYNISVSASDPAERWQWVRRGIDLLRTDGIANNPHDMAIFRELGWIHLQKIGGYTDESNQYYKRALAAEWTEVLGEPPRLGLRVTADQAQMVARYLADLGPAATPEDRIPLAEGDVLDRSRASLIYIAWLTQIDRAPDTLTELHRRSPATRTVAERIRARITTRFDGDLLRIYTQARAFNESPYAGSQAEASMGPKTTAMLSLMRDPELAPALDELILHVRKRVLTDRYRMDLPRMIRYTRQYGPIDWRHAGAHALYWTRMGTERAAEVVNEENRADFDFINTDRQVVHSIQELYRSGDIYFNYFYWSAPQFRLQRSSSYPQVASLYTAVPNPFFVDSYGEALVELRRRSIQRGEVFESAARIFTLYAAGYENFLQDVIRFYYRRGQRDLAHKYQLRLLEFEGNINDVEKRMQVYATDLNTFIAKQFEDIRYTSVYVANSEIESALQGAFIGLLSGNTDIFRNSLTYARTYHAAYMREQRNMTAAAGDIARTEMFHHDFRVQAGIRFAAFVANLDLADAEKVYDRAPIDLRQWAYDYLLDQYREARNSDVALGGRAFDEVFPEPPDMPAFRQMRQRLLEEGPSFTPQRDG
ncbi:MAG: hypothetical protein KF866_12895 [Phycisphaeraceae bacterium]|nr:hypothetical protein [Phycisphaeraceae bacterium]MCW5754153.1 hypothetical protein [Phycisphaeraceae bacterium]